MTLLPYLAVHNKHDEKTFTHMREFSMPEPTRRICVFYVRSFQKLNLINALFDEIVEAVPQNLLKKKNCIMTCLEDFSVSIKEASTLEV